VHQHAPTLAEPFLTADHKAHGDKDIFALCRPIHKGAANRQVAVAGDHAGCGDGNQGAADAQFLVIANQMVRVEGVEGKAQDGSHRSQGDIALVPSQTQAQYFFTFPLAVADDALIGHGGGIGTGGGTGEGKAGDIGAVGQSRQIVIPLLLGAEMAEQLARPQ